ncbi:MAG: response regulator [Calditrichia bacterium]
MSAEKFYSSLNILLDSVEGTSLLLEYYAGFSKRLYHARDFKSIIGSLYEELRKIYINQHIEFILWHNHKRLVKFVYNEKNNRVLPAEEFAETNTLYNYVLEKQQIVLTNNYWQFCENLGLGSYQLNASSWLGIPMVVKGKVLGMVVVWDNNAERYLRLQDKQFMSAVTDIASLAIENIYLYDYIVDKSGSYKIFDSVLPRDIRRNSIKNVTIHLLDAVLQQQDVHYTGIFLRSQYHNKWRLLSERFHNRQFSQISLELLPRLQLLQDNIFGEADNLFWHSQMPAHPLKPVFHEKLEKIPLNSVLLFPFSIEKSYFGIWIIAFQRREEQPSPEEMRLFRFISYLLVQLIEKKALIEHKKRYESYMQHLEKMKLVGEMASGSAHHLNNILSVILGKSQMLQRKTQDKVLLRDLRMIEQAADDGAKAVRRLQSIKSQAEPEVLKENLNINDLVQEVVEIARPRFEQEAQSRGIAYDLKLSLGKIYPVFGEAAALREVLLNLFTNALDSMPDGGKLSIQTTLKNDNVLVFVSDTGNGIPEDMLDKIFEPFFSTKGERGNGLGLSIATEIISRHNGKIYVDSIPQKGSIFMIELPAVKEECTLHSEKAPSVEAVGYKVLVVDDENVVRETLAEMLEDEGCEVTMAPNAEEAILKFQKYQCEVVLTDLSMPGTNGYELAKRIKAIDSHIPVFLITGWNQLDRKFMEANKIIDGVIEKPFNMEQIRNQFIRVLSGNGRSNQKASLKY